MGREQSLSQMQWCTVQTDSYPLISHRSCTVFASILGFTATHCWQILGFFSSAWELETQSEVFGSTKLQSYECCSIFIAWVGFGSFFEHNTYDQSQFAHLDNSCWINTQKTSTVSWPLHPPPSLWANGFDRKRTINIWILKVQTKLWGSQWANIHFLVARITAERRRRRREVLEGWGFKMSTSFCGMENNGQTRGCRRRARRVQGDGEEMENTWRRVLGFQDSHL